MTGNLCTPFIIKQLGLGLGLATWGLANMITGWATGHFGFFGVKQEGVDRPLMNYVGVAMAAMSIVLFAQAGDVAPVSAREVPLDGHQLREPKPGDLEHAARAERRQPLAAVAPLEAEARLAQPGPGPPGGGSWLAGFLVALVAGILFGSNFDPPTVLMEHGKAGSAAHSTNPMDYVFAHFSGILVTAGVALVVYLAVMRQRAYVKLEVILPGMLSGSIWAIAQTAWFKANDALSLVIAFPIITTLPAVVGMVWGIVLFGEFSTRRSRMFAAAALCTQIPGVLLIALS